MSYILYINQNQRVTEISLPAVDNRKLKYDIGGCELNVEVYDGVWRITGTENVRLYIDGKAVDDAEIADGLIVNVKSESCLEFAVIVNKQNAEENDFIKYSLDGKGRITIGKADDNDIVIKDDIVSSHHCVISVDDGNILIDSSTNGTFINGDRVTDRQKLNVLDTIYVAGHKIIYLGNIIAVNKNDIIKSNLSETDLESKKNTVVYEDSSLFSRAPRRIEPLDDETVEIEDPPAKQNMRSQPLIFIIGPSVTMPIPILVSVLVNIAANSSMANRGTMYLGSLLSVLLSALIGTGWALAHQFYNKKQLASDEKTRCEAYETYIENNKNLLEEKHNKNKHILENSFVCASEFSDIIEKNPELIWNRNTYQKDFLTIRLGKGKVKLPGEIAVSKQRFSLSNDELCDLPHELYDKYNTMDDCVSTLSIIQHKIIGVVGKKDDISAIANSMVCQIAALHCYTDVKIGFIMNTSEMNLYSWVKWLPHTLFQKDKLRLVGCGDTSLENVMYAISAELGHRAELSSENKGMIIPHIVIFCSPADIMQNSILSRYMTSQEYLGVTFVLLYGEMNKLPNECKAIIECSDDFQGFYLLDGEITEENKISFDMIKSKDAELFARKISGFYVNEISTGEVPSNVGYFEMLGIGRIESWDLIRHYKENRSYEGLKALIGEGIGSRPVFLDIHDKKHGPHGLVAGTTGSGKSETLQTFILSLAMNYSPDDITFVLIDYKGGGMANVFNGLPHIAGMITNLSDEANGEIDRSITRRACSSLKSEIKRRQTIFGKYKVNHIDTYSRLYREGKADEAIPHLVIISDEFAELKKEQPEFIRELISVARVGRSLGIHLILATQKPSGVVDDEIWSNSRFKICLRVQDKQDSTSMLKRSDAAYITEAGRAYLQVGNDEIFELFQSGYSGEGYIPKDKFVSAADSEAVMIDIDGNDSVIHNRKSDSNAETELEAAVKYISTVSTQYKINSAKPLWLPALGREIILDDIEHGEMHNHNGITAVYGIIDNHEKQRQYPAAIDISCCSNLKIAGASGSGKTTLLQTLLVSIVKKYTPEQVNFYVMDFSSRTFKTFRNLPHCGGVVFEEENDAVERLLKLMFDIIEERRILFGNSNVGSYNEYIKLNSLPLILLVIDNFCAFSESYEKYTDILIKLVHEGTKYGIQTIITVNNSSELKYKLRNYINSSIVLRLAEKSEYSEYIGRTPEYVPVSASGRGLTVSEGSVLEYQTALPIYGENEFERSANLKKLFYDINHKYTDYNHARVIPFISPDAKFNDLLEVCNESNALTIGYNFENLEPYNISFADFYCYCISSSIMNSISLVMKNICTYAEKNNISLGIVKLNNAVEFENRAEYVYSNADEIQELVKLLHKEFSERNAAVADWNSDNAGLSRDEYIAKKFGRLFIVIDDMTKFCEAIYNPPFDRGNCELIEYFLKEGKNHAVHFFAGYDSTHKTYSETSRVFKSENHGIHLGGKTIEQNALEINIPPADKMKELGSNIGYCVENKSVVTVFVPEN